MRFGKIGNLSIFDKQGFAEAKAYKKTGKIYCCSTFRGHRDSIIKRLIECKSGKVQDKHKLQ